MKEEKDMMKMNFKNHHTTPFKSIRAFCVQCMGYNVSEVEKCTAPKCPLYPYRMKHRPTDSKMVGLSEAIEISKRY